MTTLTVTARGQVTFRKDVLQHLGIRPGEKIELDLLPEKAFKKLKDEDITIEEINEAAAQGWAGKQ